MEVAHHEKKRISLTRFFDMMAGTSIGGIMSSALSKPMNSTSSEPRFYSDEVTQVGKTMSEFAFKKQAPYIFWLIIGMIPFCLLIGGGLAYLNV